MASGKKNLRATGRAPVLPGDRAAAAGCPRALKPRALRAEVPHPFGGSGPAGPGADQGTRFYQPRPVRRGHHHYCRDGDLLRPGPGELRDPGSGLDVSGQMSGCRWLITGLTCAGPVRPVTPPARPPQGRQGRERHHGQPCPARRPDHSCIAQKFGCLVNMMGSSHHFCLDTSSTKTSIRPANSDGSFALMLFRSACPSPIPWFLRPATLTSAPNQITRKIPCCSASGWIE